LPRQLRLPGFQQQQSKGDDVETGRGKKGKKAGWHVSLGLRDIIFATVGVVGLMMMSFALGALAGRGDIYRAAYSWGLLNPEAAKVAQWAPAPGPPTVAAVTTPGTATTATVTAPATPVPDAAPAVPAPAAVAAKPAAPAAPVAAKPAPPAPVTGSIAPLPSPEAAKKKGKTAAVHPNPKTGEEELRRERQELVKKLKFQNSFDTGPKPSKAKDHGKQAQAKAAPVRVGEFRTSKEAQAKVSELQKKGVKATLKKTRDSKGALYIVSKPGAAPAPAEKLVQKPPKTTGDAAKHIAE
jgi:hypothetical protein